MLQASSLILVSCPCHLPRLRNFPARTSQLITFRLHPSLKANNMIKSRVTVIPAARNKIKLKINGLICVSVKSKAMPAIRTATFIVMPKSLCVTRDATTLPHVSLPCSRVIMYTRKASPLTDSAGTIVSTKMLYQTKR